MKACKYRYFNIELNSLNKISDETNEAFKITTTCRSYLYEL